MQKGEGRRGLKMRRGVVAVSSVTKICLQPAISTVIHDKDEIRGFIVVSRIESVDRLFYFFLNRKVERRTKERTIR